MASLLCYFWFFSCCFTGERGLLQKGFKRPDEENVQIADFGLGISDYNFEISIPPSAIGYPSRP
jgi:hypothetical protein